MREVLIEKYNASSEMQAYIIQKMEAPIDLCLQTDIELTVSETDLPKFTGFEKSIQNLTNQFLFDRLHLECELYLLKDKYGEPLE